MSYEFPDSPKALRSVICKALDMTEDHVVLHMPLDLEANVPLIHLQGVPAPGSPEPWEKDARVIISVYAAGLTEATKLANDVRNAIPGPQGTEHGLLDDVWVETEPADTGLPHQNVRQFDATYRTISRPL